MFAKPYKLKSNNSLKNTEKKNLQQRILDSFSAAKEDSVKDLVPIKTSASCLKLQLSSGDLVMVYCVDSVPIMIEAGGVLVPALPALWKIPDLVPTITIHTPVLPKILGGAPLYLPGVEIPQQGIGFPMFARGTIIAACTADNMAAGVVGRAAMGSADMLMKSAGVCLETIHVFGDLLCKEQKFSKVDRPKFGPVPMVHTESLELLTNSVSGLSIKSAPASREEWPSLARAQPAASLPTFAPPPAPSAPLAPAPAPRLIPDREHTGDALNDNLNDSVTSETLEEEEESGIPEDMDGLLRWCLLCFLRLEGKNLELPLKTNLLYKNHLFLMCPPDRTLDVKKSTYKKMSKFLEAMQREGLLEVKEIEKGVSAVVALNLAHPIVRAHSVPTSLRERLLQRAIEEEKAKDQTEYVPPQVREVLCVTAAVKDLFPNEKKGTPLSSAEVRTTLTEYVGSRSLASTEQRGTVVLDALLAKIFGKKEQECVKWDALMSGVSGRMTASTELVWADGSSKLVKTRLEPVSMQVATRSGNKKVTLVNNLESYGFNLVALSGACQHGVGASCGVTRSPGARADQLMLQGDQTHFVAKLLIEKYGLPKKFVDNADKMLNKKK